MIFALYVLPFRVFLPGAEKGLFSVGEPPAQWGADVGGMVVFLSCFLVVRLSALGRSRQGSIDRREEGAPCVFKTNP